MKIDKKVILVVEDELPLAGAIMIKLEDNGLDVVTARTANQAIDYLKELERVDAVWLDHYLRGGGEGLEVLKYLKMEDSRFRQIPVFLVSNTASEEKINSYISFGVEKYYLKANKALQEIIDDVKNFLE